MRRPASSDNDKWAIGAQIDDFMQRIESGKVAVISGVAGSVAEAFPSFFTDVAFGHSIPQWEFNTDMFAVEAALFGLVYRYAVREDGNKDLKDGVVGAFAFTRALSMVKTSTTCIPIPLRCGEPLIYLDWNMIATGGGALVTSFIGFKVAQWAIETSFKKGWLSKFPSSL